jgi:hypothetical protein
MRRILKSIWQTAPLALLLTLFAAASFKAYVRIQTTLIGYRIGQLKQAESELLETQSTLKMELAKISTRQNLLQTSMRTDGQKREGWAAHLTFRF